MDKFKLGGVGCVLVLVGALVGFGAAAMMTSALLNAGAAFGGGAVNPGAIAAALQSAFVLILAAGVLSLVGSILAALGTFGLKERFQSPLYQIGGILVLVGALGSVAGSAAVMAAFSGGDALGGLGLAQTVGYVGLLSWVGWILVGVGLITTRQAVGGALGAGQESFVMIAGILVIIPLIQIVGFILLGLIFFKLAKGAPAAAPAA